VDLLATPISCFGFLAMQNICSKIGIFVGKNNGDE
jgi:hypothetical protein